MTADWLSPLSILLGVVSTAGVVAVWILMGRSWRHLPSTVPHHFNVSGRPDSFGDKSILWILPVIATVTHAVLLLLGVLALSQGGNSVAETRVAAEVVTATAAYSAWTLFAVTRGTIDVGLGRRESLGRWFLPVVLGAVGLLILLALIRLR